MTTPPRVYFFGVGHPHAAGHHLYDAPGRWAPEAARRGLPKALAHLDSVWCRGERPAPPSMPVAVNDPQVEGRAFIHYVDGWTVLAWWDRSGDARGGCNAAFLVEGYHRYSEAFLRALDAFPRELERMLARYSIGLAGPDLPGDGVAEAADAFVAGFRALHPEVRRAVALRLTHKLREEFAAAPRAMPNHLILDAAGDVVDLAPETPFLGFDVVTARLRAQFPDALMPLVVAPATLFARTLEEVDAMSLEGIALGRVQMAYGFARYDDGSWRRVCLWERHPGR